MAFRRFRSSGRRFSRRRFGRPLARANYLWTFATGTVNASASAQAVEFLSPTQWQQNSTAGNFQKCKLLRVLWLMSAVGDDTDVGALQYALHIDDESFSTSLSPITATFFDSVETVLRWGAIAVPGLASGAISNYQGNLDFTRDWSGRRELARDQRVWFSVAPFTNAPTSFTYYARCLVQLNG